jgi:hypothetical protein
MQETISELVGYFTEQPINRELTDDKYIINSTQGARRNIDRFHYINFYTKY